MILTPQTTVATRAVLDRALAAQAELTRRSRYKIRSYFPDCLPGCTPDSPRLEDHVIRPGFMTPICRALYVKHLAFFTAGRSWIERLFLAANRIGKTQAAAYEYTCHLTGEYPHWWHGKRFEEPVEGWCAGQSAVTTRDICQLELYGPAQAPGTGMIPAHLIVDKSSRSGTPDALDTLWVRHVPTGGTSTLNFKSYDQGRDKFQGTKKHIIWLDEEPPDDVEEECLLRTMTTGGIVIITFTPVEGLTPFVQTYLETCVMYSAQTDGFVDAKEEFWKQAEIDTAA